MSSTSASLPSAQTVWRIVRKGDPVKALVKEEEATVPKEVPRGYVLVKIQAASLNPVYVQAQPRLVSYQSETNVFGRGFKAMRLIPNSFFKRVAEHDFAGEVVDPNGNSRFKVGDQVFGAILLRESLKTGQGALAQYAYAPANSITHRPESISPNEASGIPIVAMTAYAALYQIGKLEADQRIFINGGTTSVGMYAVQFAKALGCKVYASASGKNEEFLRNLGVDEVWM